MEMNQGAIDYLQNVVKTSGIVKIGSVIIEPGRIRAIDEDRTVVLFHESNVPDFPFGSIGMNRLDLFSSRYDIAHGTDNFKMEVITETGADDKLFARALTMKAKGIKIDYRCANPATIQAPRALPDAQNLKYRIRIDAETTVNMQRGQAAMGADEITFVGNKDGVSFEIADINTDKFVNKIADDAEQLLEDDKGSEVNFTYKYPIKLITTLFRQNPTGYFSLTSRGMLKIVVNGLDLYVLPKA